MVTLWAWVAIALAAGGVVGSVVPGIPGAGLSLAGFLLYWWSTGFTDPSLPILVVVGLVAVVTIVVDVVGGAVAASAGGASPLTVAVAVVVGLVVGLLTGPVGFLVGVTAAVFAVEFYRTSDAEASRRAALYTTAGVLASAVVQGLVTLSLLVSLLLVVFL